MEPGSPSVQQREVLLEATSEGHMGSLDTSAENYPQDRPVGKEREGLGQWCLEP